jgi:hypothetical protein
MDLWKTTILPSDRQDLARKIFSQLVNDEPHVLMVVLGTGPDAEQLVDRASKNAGAQEGPIWVVWARKPKHIEELLRGLQGAETLDPDLDTIRGLTLSFADSIVEIFPAADPVPDNLKIVTAYARALSSANA